MLTSLTFVSLITLCVSSVPSHFSDGLLHHVVLDSDGQYEVSWTPKPDNIIMEITCKTHGYVGLGFSPTGGMKGADFIIGWVDDNGKTYLSDRYDVGNTTPQIDESQDVHLINGYKNETHTVIRFSRQWSTCDEEHDYKLTESTLKMIWCYSHTLPEDPDNIHYHEVRGTKSVYLSEPKLKPFPSLKDTSVRFLDIRAPNVSLPSDIDTLYWCWMIKLPEEMIKHKNHMIGYKPIIAKGNKGYFHHLVVYECELPEASVYFDMWLDHSGVQCHSPNMPPSWNHCTSRPLAVWAIGSKGEMYPDHVGQPIGEKHGGSTYFMVEVHYDNPFYHKGIIDNSGLRLYYTEHLREYDAGVLAIGHVVSALHIIPPGQNWTTIGHCSSACTEQVFPKTGLNVFSGFLHGHLLTKGIKVEHVRKGNQLPDIMNDENYDFNYQQTRAFNKEKVLLPGDHLITHCNYDSMEKTLPVFGGFGTAEEMCLSYLYYYPAVDMGFCASFPEPAPLVHSLQITLKEEGMLQLASTSIGIKPNLSIHEETKMFKSTLDNMPGSTGMNNSVSGVLSFFHVDRPKELSGKDFKSVLMQESFWKDDLKVQNVQDFLTSGTYTPECLVKKGDSIGKTPERMKYPKFKKRVEPKTQCKKMATESPELARSEDILLSFINAEQLLQETEQSTTMKGTPENVHDTTARVPVDQVTDNIEILVPTEGKSSFETTIINEENEKVTERNHHYVEEVTNKIYEEDLLTSIEPEKHDKILASVTTEQMLSSVRTETMAPPPTTEKTLPFTTTEQQEYEFMSNNNNENHNENTYKIDTEGNNNAYQIGRVSTGDPFSTTTSKITHEESVVHQIHPKNTHHYEISQNIDQPLVDEIFQSTADHRNDARDSETTNKYSKQTLLTEIEIEKSEVSDDNSASSIFNNVFYITIVLFYL